jgi:hypothetical protein
MKNYTALERDVVMKDVWTWARAAGFQHLELAIFNNESYRVPLADFEEALRGGRTLNKCAFFSVATRRFSSRREAEAPKTAGSEPV